MKKLESQDFQFNKRYQRQNAQLSIRDIYDAIIELVTNADDRYQLLGEDGRIEIEVQRQRSEKGTVLKVRDFADGMTTKDMDEKLHAYGGRVSGLEEGKNVRGTNSRGAKDITAIGRVRFESIAGDGLFHRCEMHHQFTPYESEKLRLNHRKLIEIPSGTGTLVTVYLDNVISIPQHANLVDYVSRLVPLRDILMDVHRNITVLDVNKGRKDVLHAKDLEGKVKIKESFTIPGYRDANAKLMIYRAPKQFEREQQKFRMGGILVKSRHAVHEATLFDSKLETDTHAAWFYGKLICPHIDQLWNEHDEANERDEESDSSNPFPIIDPMRKQGLTRDHPFVHALFGEALKRLRPLVELERKQAEGQRAAVENKETRKRLNKLETVAAKFMEDKQDDDEPNRDPNTSDLSTKLKENGYTLNPPFVQLIRGHSTKFWLNIRQEVFPELQVSSDVQIKCLSDEIVSDKNICGLESHPTQEGILRAVWTVTAKEVTLATGLRVRIGSIVEEATIEVFANEADKYKHVTELMFARKQYRIPTDNRRKTVVLMAPESLVPVAAPFEIECSSSDFEISGNKSLVPSKVTKIARCAFSVRTSKKDAVGVLTAKINGQEASVKLMEIQPRGSNISIKLEDIDLGNQRYRWRSNVLEIAARHPSLKRYLGAQSAGFMGQEKQHFRILLAEIVTDAVCSKIVEKREANGHYEDEDNDWNFFYAEYSKLHTEFLPIAHELQVPSNEL